MLGLTDKNNFRCSYLENLLFKEAIKKTFECLTVSCFVTDIIDFTSVLSNIPNKSQIKIFSYIKKIADSVPY